MPGTDLLLIDGGEKARRRGPRGQDVGPEAIEKFLITLGGLVHNEALRLIDIAVAAAVESVGANAPPASPADGQCFIVGSAPTGAWAGHAGAIAGYAAGGWRFVAPVAGMRALDKVSGQTAGYDGATWVVGTVKGAKLELAGSQVVGARGAAVADPSSGATVDAEARTAIVAILDRLRVHGLIAP